MVVPVEICPMCWRGVTAEGGSWSVPVAPMNLN